MPTLDLGKVIGPQGPAGRDGERGPQGIQGIQGPQGVPGPGVPAGGTPGQILSKDSAADYDAKWSDNTAAQVSYNATESGLEAETVQGALDRLSAIKVDVGRVSNPTLLDNGYFSDPINQRGQMEYIGAGYTIDRWISSSGNNEVQIGADGVNLAIQIDGAYFAQRIRPGVLNAGDVCTFSVLTTEGLFFGTETLIADGNYHGSILIGDNFYSQYIFENGSYQFAVIKNFSNTPASITLIAAKLELGPVQTLAHKEGDTWVLNDPPPDHALELAKCQMYQLPLLDRSGNYGCPIGFGVFQNTLGRIIIPTPTTMRGTPTLTVLNGNISAFEIIDVSGTTHPVATITTQGKFSNGIYLGVTITDTIATTPSICVLKYTSMGIPMFDSNL